MPDNDRVPNRRVLGQFTENRCGSQRSTCRLREDRKEVMKDSFLQLSPAPEVDLRLVEE